MTPNATLRSIRIYGSQSWWGKGSRWTPPDAEPIKVRDFPEPGSLVEVFLGEVPEQIREQIHARSCLANAFLNRSVNGAPASLDDAVGAQMKHLPLPSFEQEEWYVTLTFDRRVHIADDPGSDSSYRWWDAEQAQPVDRTFRTEAKQVLDVITAHLSMLLLPEFFETRVTESDVVLLVGDGRPVSIVPLFSGSARGSVGRAAERFPTEDLKARLASLTSQSWTEHLWLRRAIDWYVNALSSTDRWRSFQSLWLTLEILTHKLSPRCRPDVLDRLTYQADVTPSDSLHELAWPEQRAPLTTKFTIVALEFDPQNADRDLAQFKLAKKARDGLSHGMIANPDQLPIGEVKELATKYLDLALQSLLP